MTNGRLRRILGSLLLVTPALACAEPPADSVWRNGRIHTVDEARPWATAVAISDGRFVYVGDDAGAARYIGATTRVVDLTQRLVLPGFHDAHGHLLMGSLAARVQCRIPPGEFGDSQISALRGCEKKLGPEDWLVAGMFSTSQFPDGKPDRRHLDAAFPNRPVFLHEMTAHNGLVNTKALEIAGVDTDTPDPFGGKFVRDATGRVTGELIETATAPFRKLFPKVSLEQRRDALAWAIRLYNRWGVTSIQDAMSDLPLLEALQDLEQRGLLTADVETHLLWGSKTFLVTNDAETDALIDGRSKFRSRHVEVDNIKILIDGTPTAPYYTEAGVDAATHAPRLEHVLVPPDQLRNAVIRFDEAGMRVKMHVAGAGAAHVALDAIEAARRANPTGTRRHELGHTNLVLESDMDRMRALNVTGEMSPTVWHLYGPTLGNPPMRAWQFRTLSAKGVMMTVGSDWPVSTEPNLFPALQGLLFHGDESIDLASALRMVTINGAIASGKQRERGSIETGKRANFIVLTKNIVDGPMNEIEHAAVASTVFEGVVVYDQDSAPMLSGRDVSRTRPDPRHPDTRSGDLSGR
jgi:predicted amidohydrolase YtcJ